MRGRSAPTPCPRTAAIVVLNRPVSPELAERIAEQFVEVLFAPGYEDGALETLRRKEALRILESTERRHAAMGERDYRRVLGGLLAQDRDGDVEDREGMIVVCGEPERGGLGRPPLRLARVQARHLERDRDREGPPDDRRRRRPDVTRGRGADRGREGREHGTTSRAR